MASAALRVREDPEKGEQKRNPPVINEVKPVESDKQTNTYVFGGGMFQIRAPKGISCFEYAGGEKSESSFKKQGHVRTTIENGNAFIYAYHEVRPYDRFGDGNGFDFKRRDDSRVEMPAVRDYGNIFDNNLNSQHKMRFNIGRYDEFSGHCNPSVFVPGLKFSDFKVGDDVWLEQIGEKLHIKEIDTENQRLKVDVEFYDNDMKLLGTRKDTYVSARKKYSQDGLYFGEWNSIRDVARSYFNQNPSHVDVHFAFINDLPPISESGILGASRAIGKRLVDELGFPNDRGLTYCDDADGNTKNWLVIYPIVYDKQGNIIEKTLTPYIGYMAIGFSDEAVRDQSKWRKELCWDLSIILSSQFVNDNKDSEMVYQTISFGEYVYGREITKPGFVEIDPTGISGWKVTPSEFALGQNYPNPMKAETIIPFTLKNQGHVTIKVFNTLGQEVAVLADEQHMAGKHSVRMNTSNLAGGVYLARMWVNGQESHIKMLKE